MAFYIQHQPQSAKEKVNGFTPTSSSSSSTTAAVANNNNNPPSPTSTFDPSSLFFNGPMFPDPFRQPSGSNSAVDFADTLLSLIPADQAHSQHQQQPRSQQQQPPSQPPSSQQQHMPHNVFDMSHFPIPTFSNHHQQHHHLPPQREDQQQLDSPASLQTTHSFFNDTGHSHNPFNALPSYMGRPDTPATSAGGMGSPSDSSPYPTHASHARIHGHRSPSIGPAGVSASRSRSRTRTSKPPPASRNGLAKTKRTSISSTPEEIVAAVGPAPSPAASAAVASRPQAILIPSHPPPSQLRDFPTQQLHTLGPHPISPLGLHSTQTAPGAWYVPQTPNGLNSAVEGSFANGGQQNGEAMHVNRFAPSFIGSSSRSLSLGTSPKPGTSASASVLAGSLGAKTPILESPLDAAQKQAAILSEKRRRRRESHNAVERRRRDNINEKISELSTLLPDCLLDGGSGNPSTPIPTTVEGLLPSNNPQAVQVVDDDGKDSNGMKANKGIILRKSVDYIRYLQQLVRAQANRNRELEAQLSQYRGGHNPSLTPSSDTPNGHGGSTGTNTATNSSHNLNMNSFAGLEGMTMTMNGTGSAEDDAMSVSGLFLNNYSPEDTTPSAYNHHSSMPSSSASMGNPKMETSPSAVSEEDEQEERGRAVERRGRFANGSGVGVSASTSAGGGSLKRSGGSAGNGMKRVGSRSVGFDHHHESALSETEELDEMELEDDDNASR